MNAYILSLNPAANLEAQWDYGILKDFLEGKLWRPPNWEPFTIRNVPVLPNDDRAVVALPARHHKRMEREINRQLANIGNVVLFLMGDEEADFDIGEIWHNSISIWVQNPHRDKHDDYYRLGTGYPQHLKANLPDYQAKQFDAYFAGQITHKRRVELTDTMMDMNHQTAYSIEILRTKGFTQGNHPKEYLSFMARAKIAPAPSGAVIPDSFRLFEALQTMAIPIADQKTNKDEVMHDYWDWLFMEITPFPKVVAWDRLWALIPELLEDYPRNAHHITAWWISYKRKIAYMIMEQLCAK